MLHISLKFSSILLAMSLTLGANNLVYAQISETSNMSVISNKYDLNFDASKFEKESKQLNGITIGYRAYRNIVYVQNPKSVSSQSLNIYIPEDYFSGKKINGYTAKSAPIFMPNGVGGYMPGTPLEPEEKDERSGKANAQLVALSRGYVVVSPAIRGRTTVGDDGKTYVGKAPAFIVDYKAAVRYLRHNADSLPAGDTEKIISNGTSAGGALSALLGTTGNAEEYNSYLKEIGAADERDDIFASSDYCPITNLEHADMAYEWIFNGVYNYRPAIWQLQDLKARGVNNEMTRSLNINPGEKPDADAANNPVEANVMINMLDEEIAVSKLLSMHFPAYVNSLNLHDKQGNSLTLDKDGNGTFKDYIKSVYQKSAQEAYDSGIDLNGTDWIILRGNKVADVDMKKYPVSATRMKAAPAFDKLDLSSAENDEFGTKDNQPKHFSKIVAEYTKSKILADKEKINLINPMYFLKGKRAETKTSPVSIAPHFRIRHGAIDRDTSIAIPAILALSLQEKGVDVDFFSPWGRGHSGDYDLDRLFDWIDNISR
ncbi:subtype B tannase [Succinivibrio sp.]|uniref:subtype B tannase n=1 Tax=Succinivibrio sp. TaxID=2053619 RepID=UPI0025FB5CBD|nr:subtype B tannase [Succinivibrio sp.]MBQ9220324.1 hypothetical protein [Succinivibrio sp.]